MGAFMHVFCVLCLCVRVREHVQPVTFKSIDHVCVFEFSVPSCNGLRDCREVKVCVNLEHKSNTRRHKCTHTHMCTQNKERQRDRQVSGIRADNSRRILIRNCRAFANWLDWLVDACYVCLFQEFTSKMLR